jgi:cytochrome c-type biogenesis protein CcmH/NrfF
VNIRRQIAQRISQGRTDQEIRDELANAYGRQILMNPPRSGIAGLVWVLPVAGLVAALAGLAFTFRRWRTPPGGGVTPDDLAAVDRARRARGGEA